MLFRYIYSYLLIILSPFFFGYWVIQSVKHGVPLKKIKERLGFVPILPKNAIWIHAASIGELKVANMIKPHIEHLGPIIISSSTCRGATTTQTDFFLPYDHPFCVKQALQKLKPKALILIETEIWPNLIAHASCPVYLANARLSEKSFKKYQRIKPIIKNAYQALSGVWSSSEKDAKRLTHLGANITSTHPNLKYLSAQKPSNLHDNRDVIVFSCTHPGEETLLVPVFEKIIAANNLQKIVLIPRHAHRKETLSQALKKFETNLHIEDRFGYTDFWYQKAHTVFMGGSLIEHGGQNPIEPLIYGCTTIIGPHHFNFQQVVEGLRKNQLIHVIDSPVTLADLCINGHKPPKPWPFFEAQINEIKQSLHELVACLS